MPKNSTNQRVLEAFSNWPEAMGIINLNTKNLTVKNAALKTLTGENNNDIVQIITQENKDDFLRFLEELKDKNMATVQFRTDPKNGPPIEALCYGYSDNQAEACIRISNVTDIEQQNENEAQKKWIKYFERFYANTKDIVNLFSLTHRKILRWSPRANQVLGYSKGDLENLNIEQIYPPEELLKLGAAFQRLAEKGFVEEKLKCYNKIHELQDIWIRAFVIQYEPEVLCLVHTIDLTEEKESERTNLRETRLAALGEASAALAHEINNTLQKIEFDLYFLNQSSEHLPEEVSRRLKNFEGCITHIESVVRNIQSYTHISQSGQTASFISSIIDGAMEIMESYLESRQIKTTCEVEKNLPPICVDPNQIQQIFLILIKNAGQAMSNVEKRQLTLHAHLNTDCQVEVRLKDSGVGIPVAVRERLFDAFITTKSSGFGLGLGLSTAKKIAEINNVENTFDTEVGVGSEFILRFKPQQLPGQDSTQLPQHLLLYVDDRESLDPPTTILIAKLNTMVIHVQTREQVMKILSQQKVSVLMCAENMYPVPGHLIAKDARSIFNGPICVIKDPKRRGVSPGYDYDSLNLEVLQYPCNPKEFTSKLSKMLQNIKELNNE